MIRRTVHNNDLPAEAGSPMGECHAKKELSPIHIVHLKGILLHPKEDTSRVATSRQPLPGKFVSTEPFQFLDGEVLADRLLETDDVHVFPAHMFPKLISATLLPEAPQVPIE